MKYHRFRQVVGELESLSRCISIIVVVHGNEGGTHLPTLVKTEKRLLLFVLLSNLFSPAAVSREKPGTKSKH